MASVSISLTQNRITTETGYRVINEVTAAADIEEKLFLYKFVDGNGPAWGEGDDTYQHVATVLDVRNYPAAPSPGDDFYRHKKVVLDYGLLSGAIDQAAITKTRLSELAVDWQIEVDAFEGTTGYAYQSEDGEVSFSLEQEQSQEAADNYRVKSTILDSPAPVGIDRSLFLYELIGVAPYEAVDKFIRVATTDDLSQWHAKGAWQLGETHYRSTFVQVDNALLDNAEVHAAQVRTDLEALAVDYDVASDDFVGSETTTYTG